MGATLPKAVESTLTERHGGYPGGAFHVGVAEMSGWRADMEDAHLVFMREDWGFFGVFDGHGGPGCSKFVAKRLGEELEKTGCPKDDVGVKKLVLSLDDEFLKAEDTSGSTATMCIVHKPKPKPGAAGGGCGKVRLRVVNAGDSRVLLGKT